MKIQKSSVHGDMLKALILNPKLPKTDLARVKRAIRKYDDWVVDLNAVSGSADHILTTLVELLNSYKLSIELDLIFSSSNDFLYRQNGQLKLANSILEEFLPRLFDVRLVPGFKNLEGAVCKPTTCFSHMSFGSHLLSLDEGGVFIKSKDQDFSVSRPYLVTKVDKSVPASGFKREVNVSYFATEIKTNLDKTMFQEASASASDLKAAVPGAKYILLCEWLDMSPIDSKLTSIDEVIILRRQRRIQAGTRENFSSFAGRKSALSVFSSYLTNNPVHKDCLERFLFHLR